MFNELVVVSSGSTDHTDAIVEMIARSDARVRLLTEQERHGKIAAVNLALAEAKNDFIALVDADCLPGAETLPRVLKRVTEPGIGGVGTRNVPANPRGSLAARAGAAMWELHHLVNLRWPVLGGDVVGFRRLFKSLPTDAAVNDDFLIETELRARAYEIAYEPAAEVLMRVPTSLRELFRQRRRIHSGFLLERRLARRFKSTQQPIRVFLSAMKLVRSRPTHLLGLVPLLLVDSTARIVGYFDVFTGSAMRRHQSWTPAASTKQRISP